jgi:hypothetical protein
MLAPQSLNDLVSTPFSCFYYDKVSVGEKLKNEAKECRR